MQLDIKALGIELAAVVKAQIWPLQTKIAALEKEAAGLRKQLEEMPTPKDGANGINGADGRDGKDCDMEAVKALVADLVKAIPAPVNGKDGAPGKDGRDGADGKSVTLADIQPVIAEAVKSIREESRQGIDMAVKAIPVPKDGRDGKDGADGKDGLAGEKGADGAGVADLLIDRDGVLVATMTDGRMKSLGPVVGKDGRNGENGKDGADFTNASLDWEGDRTLVVRGTGGEIRKTLPIPLDAGYWREGMAAEKGDIVTHDGSAWIALKATKSKPGHEAKDEWRLFARKGRDGERGPKGSDGTPPAPIKLKKDGEGDK